MVKTSVSAEQHSFATTQWSLVLRAAQPNDPAARTAMEALCRRYWFPLYAFARRRVAEVHEAQDLTQEFFLRLLEKNSLTTASPERGRFRSFLLTSLKNFLANEWDRAIAQKRGGGRERLSLDWDVGESRLSLEPAHSDTPEREFERQWALTLLDVVIQRLQDFPQPTGTSMVLSQLADCREFASCQHPGLTVDGKEDDAGRIRLLQSHPSGCSFGQDSGD